MSRQTILFLHGFASSARGSKAQFLREKFAAVPHAAFDALDFNPTPRDFEYMTVSGLINRLRQYLLQGGQETVSLIGSSMGALVALNYAHRYGGVNRLLLLAPALVYRAGWRHMPQEDMWQERGFVEITHYAFGEALPLRYDIEVDGTLYATPPSPPAPVRIVHGRQDEVIPISLSREYADSYPGKVELVEVEADHRLHGRLDDVWQEVGSFLLSAGDPRQQSK